MAAAVGWAVSAASNAPAWSPLGSRAPQGLGGRHGGSRSFSAASCGMGLSQSAVTPPSSRRAAVGASAGRRWLLWYRCNRHRLQWIYGLYWIYRLRPVP